MPRWPLRTVINGGGSGLLLEKLAPKPAGLCSAKLVFLHAFACSALCGSAGMIILPHCRIGVKVKLTRSLFNPRSGFIHFKTLRLHAAVVLRLALTECHIGLLDYSSYSPTEKFLVFESVDTRPVRCGGIIGLGSALSEP